MVRLSRSGRRHVAVLVATLVGLCGSCADRPEPDAAQTIRTRYESALFSLDPRRQAHFGVRMYRITGDSRYVPPVLFDALLTIAELRTDLDHASDEAWVAARGEDLCRVYTDKTRKGLMRRAIFKDRRAMRFYLQILSGTHKLATYGLHRTVLPQTFQRGLELLRKVDFASFLLDEEVIRGFGAQAVNYVYELQRLGITDLRAAYFQAFRTTYPPERDAELDVEDFRMKVYGLTHIVIAASDFYQRGVDAKEFAWVLDELTARMGRILAEATPDILGEVGLCFLLAGKDDDPIVDRCRRSVAASVDPEHRMILSTAGSPDLTKGEHRNVVAYMLLDWPAQLHEGPHLAETESLRALFPRGLDDLPAAPAGR